MRVGRLDLTVIASKRQARWCYEELGTPFVEFNDAASTRIIVVFCSNEITGISHPVWAINDKYSLAQRPLRV